MSRNLSIFLPFIASLGFLGCGSDVATASDGKTPTVSNLTYSPTGAPAGAVTTIMGKFSFEDANADVSDIAVELLSPGETMSMKAPRSPVQASHLASGELAFFVQFVPPSVGAYLLTVYVVDAEQHESNRLTGFVQAK